METNVKKIHIPRVDSTNRELFRMLESETLPEGTVLWTDEQYSGKGMGNTSWESEKGLNVTASFLLFPKFLKPEDQFYLNKVISLSVLDTITDLLKNNHKAEIKWPNDIIAADKKIAGILIENIIQGTEMKCTVAGIGININQTSFVNYPMAPTSLKLLTGKSYNISDCIEKLSNNLQIRYELFKNSSRELWDKDYLNNLYRFQTMANYRTTERSFRAKICGIDKYGKLLLETTGGHVEVFDFKEVQFID